MLKLAADFEHDTAQPNRSRVVPRTCWVEHELLVDTRHVRTLFVADGFDPATLYTDKDALAVRRGHPVGRRLRQLPAFLEPRHVAVISHGQRLDMIDEWLLDAGVERLPPAKR